MRKTFIGPRLRRLRQDHSETQGAMARRLGVSPAYINLLENNQRSVSVTILLRLMEQYGVNWQDLSDEHSGAQLADLRGALHDPLFDEARPDLHELRSAQTHAPTLIEAFLKLHRAHQNATDQLLALAAQPGLDEPILNASPESAVHHFFRRQRNHFPALERAAGRLWADQPMPATDDIYTALKDRLRSAHGITVRVVQVSALPRTLRHYDKATSEILLSEALDHPNRVFQLVHMLGLIEHQDVLDHLLDQAGLKDNQGRARCLVELANYFAAAALMPYDAFLAEARASKYDFDHLATRFGVSFEQACHRATTMQSEGAQGVPLFFLRIDKAGNVTKRFNATDFQLAEYGGACPKLDIHTAFRMPGRIVSQLVEMPDASQYFVFARTVDRPTFERHRQDNRLAVAMGCTIDHAPQIGYAEGIALQGAMATPIGINCRICPRSGCEQRAHQTALLNTPVNAARRGATRYDA